MERIIFVLELRCGCEYPRPDEVPDSLKRSENNSTWPRGRKHAMCKDCMRVPHPHNAPKLAQPRSSPKKLADVLPLSSLIWLLHSNNLVQPFPFLMHVSCPCGRNYCCCCYFSRFVVTKSLRIALNRFPSLECCSAKFMIWVRLCLDVKICSFLFSGFSNSIVSRKEKGTCSLRFKKKNRESRHQHWSLSNQRDAKAKHH